MNVDESSILPKIILTPERVAEIEALAAQSSERRRGPAPCVARVRTHDQRKLWAAHSDVQLESCRSPYGFIVAGPMDIFNGLTAELGRLGWKMGKDPDWQAGRHRQVRYYNRHHRFGRKGDVCVLLSNNGTRLELETWPAYGGHRPDNSCRYGENPFGRAKYQDKLRMKWLFRRAIQWLGDRGYSLEREFQPANAREGVEYQIRSSMHFRGHDIESADFPVAPYDSRDLLGETIRNGDLRYTYDWDGRLRRGWVYQNINSMWWMVTNHREWRNISSGRLFSRPSFPLPLRRPNEAGLKTRLAEAVKAEKFEDCIQLRDTIARVAAARVAMDALFDAERARRTSVSIQEAA